MILTPMRRGSGAAIRRYSRALSLKALLAVLGLLPGCGGRRADRPNVILVVVDALRRDHLSAFGYERTSPRLDALAREGVLFDQAVSTSSQTVPVVTSLLTGLYPSETSVQYYGKKSSFDGNRPWSEVGPYVDSSLPMLAETLGGIGYQTSAVVANPWLRGEFGFDQGFDHYVALDCGDSCDGKDVVEEALAWLEKKPSVRPFFLYLHFMDVHNPYRKPGITQGIYVTEAGIDRYENGPRPDVTPTDLEYMKALYDEGILYVDRQLGSFLDALDRFSPPDRTLVVVTADHGDEFTEHGGLGHGTTLYQELVGSFLLLHYPSHLPAKRIHTPVSSVDFVPTVLELIDGRTPDEVSGKSLLTLMGSEERDLEAVRLLFSELGPIKSVRRGEWKLILDVETGERELYHLPTDPGEMRNLASMNPKVAHDLMRSLSRFVASARGPAPARTERPIDKELRERLRSLGYVE